MFSINETYSTENYNITLFPVLCVQMLKTKCYSKNLSKNVHARVFSYFFFSVRAFANFSLCTFGANAEADWLIGGSVKSIIAIPTSSTATHEV